MKILILFLIFIEIGNIGLTQDKKIPVHLTEPDKQFELVGELGVKLGTSLTVEGIIVDGSDKGYADGPNLMIQMINDKPTQSDIQIPVSPYFGEFGKEPLPVLEYGSTYSFRLYETGEFVGVPDEAYKEADILIQTTGFYFQNRLIIISGKKIAPIEWAPNDFIDENALLSGIAKNENEIPFIKSEKWKLKLGGLNKWTDSEIGKQVEVYGKIQKTETGDNYYINNSQPRLVKLEDQLGKMVKLRGIAWSMNGYWWFNYRGIDVYVEKMKELPNWNVENHGRLMEISGILEQDKLPDIDQISLKENRDLKMYYIVRQASWTPLDELLTPELPIKR